MASSSSCCSCQRDVKCWIYAVLLLAVVTLPASVRSCHFPEWVRTNGTQRDWRSVIRSQNSEFSLQLTIGRASIKAVASDAFAKSFTRYCIQEYPGQRYLVAQKEKGRTRSRYTCMTFVKRGEGVMQLSAAAIGDRMDRRLCDQEFSVTDWLVVDVNNAPDNRLTCSLKGGFDMNVYDKYMGKAYCDTYIGETRLESECSAGDSLTFQFRRQDCVPEEMFMYAKQRTYCLANWQNGNYNFTLLRHDRYQYMWVLRYPKDGDNSLTVHVFKDLFAPKTRSIIGTLNYLQISMSRRSSFNVSTICEDDYEICSVLRNPCSFNEKMALTCPRTCGICNQTVPSECYLPEGVPGPWMDAAKPERQALSVTSTSISFSSTKETMTCINWGADLQGSGQASDSSSTFMFISSTHRGCGPRYSCARLAQVSPHVMYLQVSRSRTWPLLEKEGDVIDCSKFVYDTDHSQNKNRYRGRHMRMLVSMEPNISTTCDLSDFSHFEARFDQDTSCKGRLVQSEEKDSLTLELGQRCPQDRITQRFTCLEMGSHPVNGEEMLVTRDEQGQIHCWLFPARPRNHMQLILGADCDEVAPRRIKKGRLVPLVTLVARKVNAAKSKEKEKESPNSLEIEVLENEVELGAGASNNKSMTLNVTSNYNQTFTEQDSKTDSESDSKSESKTEIDSKTESKIDSRYGYNSTEPYTVVQQNNVTFERTSPTNYSVVINYNISRDDVNITNITLSSEEPSESPSPVLVTALVVTLVVVQLTLICTCRCISW